jgi:hypothetical protein
VEWQRRQIRPARKIIFDIIRSASWDEQCKIPAYILIILIEFRLAKCPNQSLPKKIVSDLKSKKWIVAKGLMFLGILLLSSALIFAELPEWRTLLLLFVLIWASARFYYFLFYVLQHYVDSTLKYSGLWDMLVKIIAKNRGA